MHPSRPRSDTTCIDPGDRLQLHVPRGTLLFAVEGQVHMVEPPRWLAEQMVRVEQRLSPGQVHEVGQDGWVQLTALAGAPARIARVPPPAVGPRLAAGLAKMRRAVALLARRGIRMA